MTAVATDAELKARRRTTGLREGRRSGNRRVAGCRRAPSRGPPVTLPLIPAPAAVVHGSGSVDLRTVEAVTASEPTALGVATRFRADLLAWTGLRVPEAAMGTERTVPGVHVELGVPAESPPTSRAPADAHQVVIDDEGVLVRAATAAGLYRGLTSVVQLAGTGGPVLPQLRITDHGRYGWRGLSLDVARCIVPVADVERVIDLLALYKFSVLHLHLTDTEGWRLEISSWPQLTANAPGGQREYYTQEEFAGLVAYAQARHVTLVPEIDLPGHAGAVLRVHPELGAATVSLQPPIPIANLDAQSERTWRFVEDVLGEVAALTAGPYLHLGGDEAFGMADDAHAAFVSRTARIAEALGKIPVGWQEAGRGELRPGQVLQHWIDFTADAGTDADADAPGKGTNAGEDPDAARQRAIVAKLPRRIRAMLAENFAKASGDLDRIAAAGAGIVLSPNSRAYLDRPHAERSGDERQDADRGRLGLPFYPPTAVRRYLEWDPEALAGPVAPDRVLGVEAAVWGETARTMRDYEALILPRLTAIAEVAWARPDDRSWAEFRERLARHAVLWSRQGWNWWQAESVDWVRP